jgi:hypothetical protein
MGMNPRLLRPTATGFDPRRIAGLEAWWDASVASSVTLNSGNVSQWNDLSGQGKHLTQSTAGQQPEYSLASVNNRNAVVWPNASNTRFLLSASLTAIEVFTVHAYADGSQGTWYAFAQGLFGVGTATIGVIAGAAGGDRLFNGIGFNTGRINNGADVELNNRIYLPRPLTVLHARAASSATGAFYMGADRNNAGLGRGWSGPICECLVYSSTLNDASRSAMARYLGKKWGISVS